MGMTVGEPKTVAELAREELAGRVEEFGEWICDELHEIAKLIERLGEKATIKKSRLKSYIKWWSNIDLARGFRFVPNGDIYLHGSQSGEWIPSAGAIAWNEIADWLEKIFTADGLSEEKFENNSGPIVEFEDELVSIRSHAAPADDYYSRVYIPQDKIQIFIDECRKLK